MTEEEDKRERLMQKKLQRQPVDQKGLGALEKGQWMPQPSTGSPYRDQEAGTHTKAPWAPDAGRDWGQEKKGTTEDEMTGWHHRIDAHEFG